MSGSTCVTCTVHSFDAGASGAAGRTHLSRRPFAHICSRSRHSVRFSLPRVFTCTNASAFTRGAASST